MNNAFLWIILLVIAAPIVGAVITAKKTNQLQRSFVSLGNVFGMNEAFIVNVAGEPQSRSDAGPDSTLLQWQAHGYHVALAFTNNVCTGIRHEYSA